MSTFFLVENDIQTLSRIRFACPGSFEVSSLGQTSVAYAIAMSEMQVGFGGSDSRVSQTHLLMNDESPWINVR